jgi:hypothetical protein
VRAAESCISQQVARETPRLIGAKVDLTPLRPGLLLSRVWTPSCFGETQGRILITVSNLNATKVLAQAKILGVAACRNRHSRRYATLEIHANAGDLKSDVLTCMTFGGIPLPGR